MIPAAPESAIDRTLIIVESDAKRFLESSPSGSQISQTGHYLEELAAFASSWSGTVAAIMPPGGNDQNLNVDIRYDLVPQSASQHQRRIRRWSGTLLRHAARAQFGALAGLLLRAKVEAVADHHTARVIARALREHPGALILIPSANEALCESIVRHRSDILAAAEQPVTVVMSWHHSRFNTGHGMDEQFTSQLRRWSDRARPLQLQHTSAMESNAARWSSAAMSVPWLPWPLDAYETGEDRDVVSAPGEPRIYLYATRPEHGSQHLLSLVEGIRREFSGGCKIRLWTGTRVAAELNANEHARRALDGVEILSKGGDLAPFQASMRGSDIAVLPYDVAPYIGRGSGALINLMVARIPVVVPAGTGLGDFVLHEGVGRTYRHRREIPTLLREMLQEAGGYDEAITRYLQKHQAAARLLVEIGGASR